MNRNKPSTSKQASKRGFHEAPDPTCIVKGKAKARKHYETAIRESLKETITAPMEPASTEADIPELPSVPDAVVEAEPIRDLNFPVASHKVAWVKAFFKKNGLDLKRIRGNMYSSPLCATYINHLKPYLATWEADYESEIQNKSTEANDNKETRHD